MIKPNPNEPLNCPHCGISLLGEPIPEADRGYFLGTHFKREIGVEVRGVYDGVYYWMCPDCKGEWGGHRSLKK